MFPRVNSFISYVDKALKVVVMKYEFALCFYIICFLASLAILVKVKMPKKKFLIYLYAMVWIFLFVQFYLMPLNMYVYLSGINNSSILSLVVSVLMLCSALLCLKRIIMSRYGSESELNSDKEEQFNLDGLPKKYYIATFLPIVILIIMTARIRSFHLYPIISLINVVIIAPIMEEIGFRFLLSRLLGKKEVGKITIIIFSIIFALQHSYPRRLEIEYVITYYLSIFTVSVYCYLLFKTTKRLFFSILFHAVWNVLVCCYS